MRFFVLKPDEGNRFSRRWAYAEKVEPVVRGPCPRCPVCDAAVGKLSWNPPYHVKLSSANPRKWGDFVWGAGFDVIVSRRFVDAYENHELDGLGDFAPRVLVHGVGCTHDELEGSAQFYVVKVHWNGANMDDALSGAIRAPERCTFCRPGVVSFDRVVIETGSWQGRDIFGIRGIPGVIAVSERLASVIERHELTNSWLIPCESYAFDVSRSGLWYVNDD